MNIDPHQEKYLGEGIVKRKLLPDEWKKARPWYPSPL